MQTNNIKGKDMRMIKKEIINFRITKNLYNYLYKKGSNDITINTGCNVYQVYKSGINWNVPIYYLGITNFLKLYKFCIRREDA